MANRVRRLPGVSFITVLCLAVLVSGCRSELELPSLNAHVVTPAKGVARQTEFTFSADVASSDYEVVLMLWSPNVQNEWSWASIPMLDDGEGHYTVSKALAEHSGLYRYKYALADKQSGDILLASAEFDGPKLVVDTNDNTAPVLLRSMPADGSVGVDPEQTITLVFDEVIDPASVTAANVQLSDPDNPVANITAFQNRVQVSFAEPFKTSSAFSQTDSAYTLQVFGVSDLNGNMMSQSSSFTFYIDSEKLQTWALESRKYSGNCLTVKDVKKRFADPQTWNPVVEITDCENPNPDFTQRWFLQKTPGESGSGTIRWSANFNYCLSKKAISDPVIELCDESKAEQNFSFNSRDDYYLIESDAGGCVAVGITDIGDKNKVESSLCSKILQRNHWTIHAREKQHLTPPLMLGKYNVSFADIQYSNPLAGVDLTQQETRDLVKYLYQTQAVNQKEMVDELGLVDGVNKGEGFVSANPYFPRYHGDDIPLPAPRSAVIDGQEVVNPEGYDNTREGYHFTDDGIEWYQQKVASSWFSDITHDKAAASEVCAVRFLDGSDREYELRTFASVNEAQNAGWIVTHQYKCGSCSTLKDLAVYIGVKDQTTPIRLCTKRGRANNNNLDQVKQCIQESVGFTSLCAETWAYNGIHTGQECQSTCLKTYGNDALLWPRVRAFFTMIIAEKFNACPPEVETDDPVLREQMKQSGCPLANEKTGKLNDCLWCDEKTSGPGFKYTAGRTRRASGLESAIPRPNDKLFYEADHTQYFDQP